MRHCRYKPRGVPRIYDHDEIKRQIREGKGNSEIAQNVGCSPHLVWKLKTDKEKRRVTF